LYRFFIKRIFFLTAEAAVCTEIFLSWMLLNASFCYHKLSDYLFLQVIKKEASFFAVTKIMNKAEKLYYD